MRVVFGSVERGASTNEEQTDEYKPVARSCESNPPPTMSNSNKEHILIRNAVDQNPDGYPKIAAFQASDRSFLLYRGFRTSHCRVLSVLQHGLVQLEQELEQLDAADAVETGARKLASISRDNRNGPVDFAAGKYPPSVSQSRTELVALMKKKLREYGIASLSRHNYYMATDTCRRRVPAQDQRRVFPSEAV